MGALDYRDKIRSMAELKPVQPMEVAKAMNTNSMLASAMLSEMSEKGILKVSNLKVGSSPLYYDPARQEVLLEYVKHLNEKDRKTVALLQEKGVLRDTAEDPLTRVSLRNTKDFCKPLDVVIDGAKEMFWKFYLLTDEQAAERIRQVLQPTPAPVIAAPKAETLAESKPVKARKPRAKKEKVADAAQTTVIAQPAPVAPAPVVSAPQAPAAEPQPASVITDDPFLQQLMTFFAANSITVLEQVVLKKKSEYDFVVQLASPVGQLHYYCKAKNKAKVGEADLSHAYVQGQLKKLPVLFLAPGALTKPAQDLLKELKGLTVKQV